MDEEKREDLTADQKSLLAKVYELILSWPSPEIKTADSADTFGREAAKSAGQPPASKNRD